MFDFPTSGWRAYLNGSQLVNVCPPCADCSLTVDLEGGGTLKGTCSVVEVDVWQAQVESGCQPDQFVEPSIIEAE